MTGKFGQIERLKNITTAKMALEQIEGAPVLEMRPATEDNREYFNAAFQSSKKRARKAKAQGLDVEAFKSLRDQDRLLFSKYVIVGWEKVVDFGGTPVVFTEEDCREFLKALPTWLFDEVRAFANEPLNFLKDDALGVEDGDELGES